MSEQQVERALFSGRLMEKQHRLQWRSLVFRWRTLIVLPLIAFLVQLNFPTKYELLVGTGFMGMPATSSTTLTVDVSCRAAGFPKTYFYSIQDSNSDRPTATWFSPWVLISDVALSLLVVVILLVRYMSRVSGRRIQIGLADICALTLCVAMIVAWLNERKVLSNHPAVSMTKSPTFVLSKSRVWQATQLFTSFVAAESRFNLFHVVGDVEMEQPTANSLVGTLSNPLIERIAISDAPRADRPLHSVERPQSASKKTDPLKANPLSGLTRVKHRLPMLRVVELDLCDVDAQILEWIKSKNNLEILSIRNSNIGEISADFFSSLPNLKVVDLRNSVFDEGTILRFADCPRLEKLVIDVDSFTNDVADSLASHPGLKDIELSGATKDFQIDLHDLPKLERLSIPFFCEKRSVILRNLRELTNVGYFENDVLKRNPWIQPFLGRIGGTPIEGLILHNSTIANCPKLRFSFSLDFRDSNQHSIDALHSDDSIQALFDEAFDPNKGSNVSQRDKELTDKNFDRFLSGLPPIVEGGRLSVHSNIPSAILAKIPCGLQRIVLGEGDLYNRHLYEDVDGQIDPMHIQKLPLDVLQDTQLRSCEEFSTSFVLSADDIERCFRVMPNLRIFSARWKDCTDLVIRDHLKIKQMTIEPEHSTPLDGPLKQLRVMNCPMLEQCQVWSDDVGFIGLYNLPRLQSINSNGTAIREIRGLSSLINFYADSSLFCGDLRSSLKASSQLSQLDVYGHFGFADLKGCIDDHRDSLRWVALRSREIESEMIDFIKANAAIPWTVEDCTIHVDHFLELLAFETGPAIHLCRPSLIGPSVKIEEEKIPVEQTRLIRLQLDGAKLDDASARWLAQHARTNHLELMGADCKAELLLPVLLQDDKATLEWSDTRSLTLSTNLFSTEFIEALNAFPNRIFIYTDSQTTPEHMAKIASRHIVKSIQDYQILGLVGGQ